ncbi:unnamed protein product [Acanthosepion pharaonis]|uniref:BHLH domain-containing protein n=1 Tax=Acanthosepion pharaonis TaxID=158019 RepID=A0A812EIF2_ACAPH|nr:unnamed protein product [Sepia pharaonis]
MGKNVTFSSLPLSLSLSLSLSPVYVTPFLSGRFSCPVDSMFASYMMMVTNSQNQCSSSQRLARKRVRLHLRRLRHKEYSKLRTLVPSVAHNNKVSKVTVIEEAIKYIDSLHKALVERLQSVQPAGVQAKNAERFPVLLRYNPDETNLSKTRTCKFLFHIY